MKKPWLTLALALILAPLSAHATQSTINPLLPVQNSPLTSAPIRGNFADAWSDINNLYTLVGAGGGGTGTVTNVTCSATAPVVCSVASGTTAPVISISLSSSGITFGSTLQNLGTTVSNLDGLNIGATVPGTGAFTALSASGLTLTSALSPANGGTGATGVPTDGQVLIGSTSSGVYTPAVITPGSNISITNGPGSIIIAATTTASSSVSLSSITSGTGSNTIDNTNNAQVWQWGTLAAATALKLTSTGITTGRILDVENTNTKNVTGYSGYFAMLTTGTGYAISGTTTGAANTGYGVYGVDDATTGYGVYGSSSGGVAVYANGKLTASGAITLANLTTGALSSNGTGNIVSGTLANSFLTNASVTVSPGTGLTGGGSVALGAVTTVSLTTPVIVANGGTGAGTFTANGVMLGNGTSALGVTATAASSALVSSTTGIASWSQTLPTAIQQNITALGAVTTGTVVTGMLPANQIIRSIEFVIDGGGSTITTGVKGFLMVPMACTITKATLLGDQSGSIVVDIWAKAFASSLPTVANTITASDLPTISSAVTVQDSTLTGWTTSLAANSMIGFNVNSVTTMTRVTVALQCNGT